MRRWIAVAAMTMAGAAALTGCANLAHPHAATGSTVTITPLAELAGAKSFQTNLITIQVPAGMTPLRLNQGKGESVDLRVDGAPRASVVVFVTDQRAGADNVGISSENLAANLKASGVASDIARSPATWAGFTSATVMTYTLHVDVDGTIQDRDGFAVTATKDGGHHVVTISAEAPQGQLESSDAFGALRTLTLKD